MMVSTFARGLLGRARVGGMSGKAPVPDGKKSLAYNICYRAEGRTLTDSEVNPLHQSVVDRIGREFGAERRS